MRHTESRLVVRARVRFGEVTSRPHMPRYPRRTETRVRLFYELAALHDETREDLWLAVWRGEMYEHSLF